MCNGVVTRATIVADDWAALVACAVVAWNGVRLFRGGLSDLLDVTARRGP